MKLTGKIVGVGEQKSGLSTHIGQWVAQDYVLQFLDGDYERKLVFTVFGESKIKEYDLHEGDTVEAFIRFGVRESGGRTFNNIEAGFVRKLTTDKGQQTTDNGQQTTEGAAKPIDAVSVPLVAEQPKTQPQFTPMNDGPSELPF